MLPSEKNIIIEMLKSMYLNVEYIYKLNAYDPRHHDAIKRKKDMLSRYLDEFMVSLEGETFQKLGEVKFKYEEVNKLESSFMISPSPEIKMASQKHNGNINAKTKIKYMSFADITDKMNRLIDELDIKRLFCLLDEWSEIPLSYQPLLSELLKRVFITAKVTFKISAIPNRTRFTSENRIGLEDGGDIFGISLDNRFIY